MLAVIKTGGKQYLAFPNKKIKIEKIDKREGEEIIFSEILLLEKNDKIEIGKPLIPNVEVVGKILKQVKGKKVIIFKYKPKKRYQKKKGHRQLLTEVEITEIRERSKD